MMLQDLLLIQEWDDLSILLLVPGCIPTAKSLLDRNLLLILQQ